MIVTSVQIKTAKTQKHLYCLVFTQGSKVILAPFRLSKNPCFHEAKTGVLRQSATPLNFGSGVFFMSLVCVAFPSIFVYNKMLTIS